MVTQQGGALNRCALAGLVAVAAIGAWLIAAPFVLGYQRSGAPWTGAAKIDVLVGAILVLAGFAGFFAALAGRVRELYAEAELRTRGEAVASVE